MNKYFEIKFKEPIPNIVEVFVVFKARDLYALFKNNSWKKHDNNISQYFKGYNDKHMAMKFATTYSNADKFANDLKSVLEGQIRIYEISNISYDDFNEMAEKRKRDNYDAFMAGLRGDYKFK